MCTCLSWSLDLMWNWKIGFNVNTCVVVSSSDVELENRF